MIVICWIIVMKVVEKFGQWIGVSMEIVLYYKNSKQIPKSISLAITVNSHLIEENEEKRGKVFVELMKITSGVLPFTRKFFDCMSIFLP